ncbi:MAG: hypothetical protein COU31_04390 [Candidatus Magasanikbacteria bacterium CG10_big_fil_rev_8_21_14_0_10_40_10]|uniref:PPM-type phosphatase domain-containing protein n=1 Tax=Candidatus Magasanikbacteria bacterium CG10_big_fil_rev_8_21_14_0_10_40_10 TaxID=1974648 RepID=A0A2M6W314_9BACT|nr:MAG: hypothetical protein COU31_04390 [Candidatus Magasanikbacteria bacterium CG10_big_fil_rev_8_21_14_0_10_40_10]
MNQKVKDKRAKIMENILQLNEFFVEGDNPSKSHVLLNITEPSTPSEKTKGYFFALCDVANADKDRILKLQNIIDEIENRYYEVEDEEDKTSLEIVLHNINQQALLLARATADFNCVIGAIRQTDIIFSFYGSPQIIIFYKNKQGSYEQMDLVKQNQIEEAKEDEQMLFAQIIQGKISANDYFFAGTTKINDYFSNDRLQKIITQRPPRQSAEHIQRVLQELKNELSFGGLIIHLQERQAKNSAGGIKPPKKGSSQKSLRGLFNTEQITANILSPSLLNGLKKISHKLETAIPLPTANDGASDPVSKPSTQINALHLRARPDKTDIVKKTSINWAKIASLTGRYAYLSLKQLARGLVWLFLLLGSFFGWLAKIFGQIFNAIFNIHGQRQEILDNWSHGHKNFWQNIRQIPIVVKILILFIITSLAILTGVILYIKHQQATKQANAIFNESIQKIKEKKDSAESLLIYNNTTDVFTALAEAKKLYNELDCSEPDKKTICDQTNKDIEEIFNRVRRLYTITPKLLIDWKTLGTAVQADKITLINKKIIGFNSQNNNVFVYDQLSKTGQASTAGQSSNGLYQSAVPKEQDYALFYGSSGLTQYDPVKNTYATADISFPFDKTEIAGLTVYSRRLYSLDRTNNQIYRHDAIQTGFAKGKEWIAGSSGVDLSKAVGLTIDGDIYTATQDGHVYKFNNGQKQDYSLSGVDPALANINQIWTYYELKYLYILDSVNKRLVIIDKADGSLKKQLTATEFNQPQSMVVDEPNNTAYILDSNKVYELDLAL